jgi:hypothetical protein
MSGAPHYSRCTTMLRRQIAWAVAAVRKASGKTAAYSRHLAATDSRLDQKIVSDLLSRSIGREQ